MPSEECAGTAQIPFRAEGISVCGRPDTIAGGFVDLMLTQQITQKHSQQNPRSMAP
jgi:hypothetical protein